MHLATGSVRDSETTTFLSEIGTNLMEFEFGFERVFISYLTEITGDPKYREFSLSILNSLKKVEKNNGLFPTSVPFTLSFKSSIQFTEVPQVIITQLVIELIVFMNTC